MARNGFTRIPNSILAQPWAANPSALCLYTWLSLNADENGQVMTSRTDLAERTGLTIQQLRTAIGKLESTKFITKSSTKLPTKLATVLTVSYLAGCKAAKSDSNQVNNQVTNQVNNQPRAYKNDNYNIMSNKTIEEKETTSDEVVKKEDNALSFDVFWKLYDKKVGKVKAQKLYEALSDKDRKAALEYIPLYVSSQPDKQYRKNPETFLRNRAWEDELIPRYETTHTYQQHHGGVTSNEQVVRNTVDLIAEARQREDSGFSQEIWQP